MILKAIQYFLLSALAIVFICLFGFFAWVCLSVLLCMALLGYTYVNFIKKDYIDER